MAALVVLMPRLLQATPDPAAVYCETMGYSHKVLQTPEGARGVVVVKPGIEFDAWDFYRGKVGGEYSYGARLGYETICERRAVGDHVEEQAVCIRRAPGGRRIEARIAQRALLEKHGRLLALREDPPPAGPVAHVPDPRRALDLPASFSWTNYNGHSYIGPIRHQGSCGSCYAFGAVATAEGVYNVANGFHDEHCADFSESFLMWCLGRIIPYRTSFFGCDGGSSDFFELVALTNEGVCHEADFPYRTSDPGTCDHWDDPRVDFADWRRVECGDIAGIKSAILVHGVVEASVNDTPSFHSYSGGIWGDANTNCDLTPCYDLSFSHAVALVGWDDADGGYWILRNSWGTGWGENGYMRIRYDAARVACRVVYLTYEFPPPVVATLPATMVSSNTATFNGTVDPRGLDSIYWFEYGTNSGYGLATPPMGAVTGWWPVAVNAGVTGLCESTLHHVRLVATNRGGTGRGADQLLVSSGAPAGPLVLTDPAAGTTATNARLRGRVSPRGAATTVWFEYGPTTNYGFTTPPAAAGSGWALLAASNHAGSLSPSSAFHFRAAASNEFGLAYGGNQAFFTTPACLLAEGFENNGQRPYGWTQAYVTNYYMNWTWLDWTFVDGDGDRYHDRPARAHGGSYNASLYRSSATTGITRLISPPIQFGPHVHHAQLSFWHYMEDWTDFGRQDELQILYRTSSVAPWATLQVYTSSVAAWTRQTLDLPAPGSNYSVAFQGVTQGGYGVAVDDVLVTGLPFLPPATITDPATDVTEEGAALNARVIPNGQLTDYWFEYGAGTQLNWTTPARGAGEGGDLLAVREVVAGLDEATPYHVRVVASNAAGVQAGADMAFTTRSAARPVLGFLPEGITETTLLLQWSSELGRTYGLYFSSDLLMGFEPLATNLPGTPPLNIYTDQIEQIPMRFYQLQKE